MRKPHELGLAMLNCMKLRLAGRYIELSKRKTACSGATARGEHERAGSTLERTQLQLDGTIYCCLSSSERV